jgi:ATP-grasp domain
MSPQAIKFAAARFEYAGANKIRSVLLVDVGWSHSLRLANDFAKAGFTVYLLSKSRFLRAGFLPSGVILLPVSKKSKEKLIHAVDAAVKAVSPDMILPLSEEVLFDIWDQDPSWASRVRPAIDAEHRTLYRSKFLLSAFAEQHGVLVPKIRVLKSWALEDLPAAIDEMDLPVVVKGEGGAGGSQVRIAETQDEALLAAIELRDRTGKLPVLQECLTGASYLVGGVFERGRALRIVGAEETEMLPALTGPAIELTSRNEPELIQAALKVFEALEFSGIANADFVRGRDGRFRFLEVNPRPWGSYGLAERLGIDLVGVWARLLRGEPVSPMLDYAPDRIWAKMPDYLYNKPLQRRHMLRRAFLPTGLRSWSWSEPRVLLNEIMRAGWTFLRGDLVESATPDETEFAPVLLSVNNERPLA